MNSKFFTVTWSGGVENVCTCCRKQVNKGPVSLAIEFSGDPMCYIILDDYDSDCPHCHAKECGIRLFDTVDEAEEWSNGIVGRIEGGESIALSVLNEDGIQQIFVLIPIEISFAA